MYHVQYKTMAYWDGERELIFTINQAANQNKSVIISYKNERGKHSVRNIQPHTVERGKGRDMLIKAFDLTNLVPRTFKSSNILSHAVGTVIEQTSATRLINLMNEALQRISINTDDYTIYARESHYGTYWVVTATHKTEGLVISSAVNQQHVNTVESLNLEFGKQLA